MDMYDELTDLGEYNRDSDVDLFCARKAFLPEINERLRSFQLQWNCHSLSTEGQRTPDQLFISGAMQHARGDLMEAREVLGDDVTNANEIFYGVEDAGIVTDNNDDILVPTTSVQLSSVQQAQINDVLLENNDFEFDLGRHRYFKLRRILRH